MIRLRFPLHAVLAAADHAVAAPDHQQSYLDTLNGAAPAPALWLVGDDGLYLMSNGLPRPDATGQSHVVHAEGYRTAMAKHAIDDLIGGDDFVKPLTLLDSKQPGEMTLHALLTAGVPANWTLFAIDIGPGTLRYYLANRMIIR